MEHMNHYLLPTFFVLFKQTELGTNKYHIWAAFLFEQMLLWHFKYHLLDLKLCLTVFVLYWSFEQHCVEQYNKILFKEYGTTYQR